MTVALAAASTGWAAEEEAEFAKRFPPAEPWQIAGMRAAMTDPSLQVRAHAAALCADRHWVKDVLKVEDLLPLLQERDHHVRLQAAYAMGMLGPQAAPVAVPVLMPLLQEHELLLSIHVRQALAQLGHEPGPRTTAEVRMILGDMYTDTHWNSLTPLQQLGRQDVTAAVRELVLLLKEEAAPNDRKRVACHLGDLGREYPHAVTAGVVPLLQDPAPEVRSAAATALQLMDRKAAPCFKELLPLLQDADASVQGAALVALGHMGPQAVPAIQERLPLLQDPVSKLRESLVKAVGALGQDGRPFAHLLLPLLADSDPNLRFEVRQALEKMGPADATCISALLARLHEPGVDDKTSVVITLGEIGSRNTASVVAELVPLLKDPDSSLRNLTAGALGQLGKGTAPPEITSALLPLLHDPDPMVRRSAVGALIQTGGQPTSVLLHTLLPLLQDPDRWVWNSALSVLAQMGAEAAAHTRELLPLLSRSWRAERDHARAVFDHYGNTQSDAAWQCTALAAKAGLSSDDTQEFRAHLYLWAGRDPDLLVSVRWLGRWPGAPLSAEDLSAAEQQAALQAFLKLWPASSPHPALRQELAERIGTVAFGVTAMADEKLPALLEKLESALQTDPVPESREASFKALAGVQRALAARRAAGK